MMAALNNDAMMKAFIRSGGDKTIASIQTIGAFLETTEWIERLPLKFEDDLRMFVHAGVRPDVPLADQTDDDLLWIREPFLNYPGPFPRYVVHGHTPTLSLPGESRRPHVFSHRCNLDTGAVFGGPLSAGIFTEKHAAPVALVTTEGSILLRSR
jgi:serine/threonine protein phosphatase 1